MSAATSPSLAGRRVVVTRTREQASELTAKLQALGAEVLEMPVLRISKEVSKDALADVMLEFGSYDWVVFTSGNGAWYFFEEFFRIFDDIRALGGIRIACVGGAAAKIAADLHLKVECQPAKATAESLADELVATGSLDHAKVLVITGNLNRDALVKKLEAALAIVDTLQVYKTEKIDLSGSPAAADFRDQGAALELGPGARRPLFGSIGPQTGATMKKCRIPVDFEAPKPGIDELIGALVKKLE